MKLYNGYEAVKQEDSMKLRFLGWLFRFMDRYSIFNSLKYKVLYYRWKVLEDEYGVQSENAW